MKTEDGESTAKEPSQEPANYGGVKFGGKMTQEEIDALSAKFLSAGWNKMASDSGIAFISACGGWIRNYDMETGRFVHAPVDVWKKMGCI